MHTSLPQGPEGQHQLYGSIPPRLCTHPCHRDLRASINCTEVSLACYAHIPATETRGPTLCNDFTTTNESHFTQVTSPLCRLIALVSQNTSVSCVTARVCHVSQGTKVSCVTGHESVMCHKARVYHDSCVTEIECVMCHRARVYHVSQATYVSCATKIVCHVSQIMYSFFILAFSLAAALV